jgi:Tol biopolymer transport system component
LSLCNPDGRLIAYTSNSEVYVSPIDGSWRRRVSRSGGAAPRWSRSGRELFFRTNVGAAGADTLFSARIDLGSDFDAGEPEVVMTNASFGGGYAILPGDTTIVTGPTASSVRRPVIVIMNFARELERLLPPR